MRVFYLLLVGLFILIHPALTQTKHALLVGIANYPDHKAKQRPSWKNLSSDNDLRILKEAILLQGFMNESIIILSDEDATVKNIEGALNDLVNTVKQGDVVMVHFSGHGQQVRDLSGDESDGYDESFVCHQAPVACYDGYLGQDHLLDDDMGKLFSELRLKLGASGHLLVLFDSCHSGTATRGNDDAFARDGAGPLDFDCNSQPVPQISGNKDVTGWNEFIQNKSNSATLASMVVISACRSDEVNYEYTPPSSIIRYGALSYAFVQVFKKPGLKVVSYADVLDELRKVIAQGTHSQTPQIEGDVYSKILNGTALEPSQYLQVYTSGKKNVEIEGGFLAGHGVGDSIAFYALSKLYEPIAVGVITQLHETRSGVQLKTILTNNYAQCKAKHIYSAASSIKRTLKITGECRNLEEVMSTLGKSPFFVLATEGATDYTLALDKKSFTIFSSDGITPLRSMKPTPVDSIHVLTQRLEEITRIEIFREKTQVEPSIAVDVRCERLKSVEHCNAPDERLDLQCVSIIQEEDTLYLREDEWANNELYAIQDGDFICVYVYNNEPKSVYITPFEISPNGRIYIHGPDELVSYYEIKPSTDPIPISILQISAADGYGSETLKLIVSKEPVNLINSPIAANGTDLAEQVYFSKDQKTDNSLASMFGFRRKDGTRGSLDEDKDMSIINIPLIMK
jgi:hypothetical protein